MALARPDPAALSSDSGYGGASPRSGAAPRRAHERFGWIIRAGFVARALTYTVIAVLALALAVGIGIHPASASPQGALSLISGAPLGQVALAVISLALLAYALWKLALAVRGRGPEGGGGHSFKDRLACLGGGLVYLAFFAVSVAVLAGSAGNGSSAPRRTATKLMELPAGEILCAVAAVALVAVSLYQAYDAICGQFANDNKVEHMSLMCHRVFMIIGRIGLLARALIFTLIGYFLFRAAIALHARTAVGVNGALDQVHREPFGGWLLALVALGLLTFAAFSLLEARYRRL